MTRPHRLASRLLAPLALSALLAFTGCSLTNAPTNQAISISGAPTVRIVAPPPNATYLEGVRVNTQALIANAGADLARVEIAVDGTVVQTLEAPNTSDAPTFSIAGVWPAAGVGAHTVSVTAFRADGTRSDPVEIAFNVVADQPTATPTLPPTATRAATATLPPTTEAAADSSGSDAAVAPDAASTQGTAGAAATSAPAATAGSTTSSGDATAAASGRPQATFNQGINVRSGPSTLFAPPIGSFAAGQTTEITAVNTDGTWWKVRYYNGEGWIFAGLATASGNLAALPRDAGPALPTATAIPVVATAAPALAQPTAAPAASTNVNLVAGDVILNPAQPVCNGTISIGFDVANLGSAPSTASSMVSVVDVRKADGSSQQTTNGGFPILQPNETFRVNMFLTVSTWVDEDHEIRLVIDPNNAVPETTDGDNTRTLTYRLQRGSCP